MNNPDLPQGNNLSKEDVRRTLLEIREEEREAHSRWTMAQAIMVGLIALGIGAMVYILLEILYTIPVNHPPVE